MAKTKRAAESGKKARDKAGKGHAEEAPAGSCQAVEETPRIGEPAREVQPVAPEFRIAATESAAEWLGNLTPGCRVVGVSKGQFSFLDLMRAVLDQIGPARVALSAWTAGIQDIEHARWLIDNGVIESLWWLIDRSFASRQPSYCQRLVELYGEGAIRITNTHAKFATLRNEGWSIAIRGSANFNRNRRLEQFDVDDSVLLCDHFDDVVAAFAEGMPPGPYIPGETTFDVFQQALEESRCGDARRVDWSVEERLAALWYTDHEIRERLEERDPIDKRRDEREDAYREAVIEAANGGDVKAQEVVGAWIARVRCRN